jgi:Ethylbenzene dehydrogenase
MLTNHFFTRTPSLRLLVAAGVLLVAACGSDDDGSGITPPVTANNYQAVAQLLQADCGSCHGTASGRAYTVTMDSASLVTSGFIDPTAPGSSLLLVKTRATSHGGGVVSAFSTADSTAVAQWISKQPATGATSLVAYRTVSTISPDGFDAETDWRLVAKPLYARIGGGWSDATEVSMRALYDATNLYLLLQWTDDVASTKRQPFMKDTAGTWRKAAAKPLPADGTDWIAYMGKAFNEEGPGLYYEDKMSLAWNTYGASTSPAFEQSGCAGLCHDPSKGGAPGTTYYYSDQARAAKKYTNAPNEIVDLWHWKLVRQDHNLKMDDQYVRHWVPGPTGAGEGGRASDAGAGGYADAPFVNGRPVYRGRTIAPGPFYFPVADTVRLTAAELDALPAGSMITSMMTSAVTGTPGRADIDAKGYFNPATRKWTYEIKRKLVTGDDKDVQFNDLTRTYKFGVAVFDNAQIEHSWSPSILKLTFKP